MGGERSAGLRGLIINEFIALAFWHSSLAFEVFGLGAGRVPGLSAVVGALDDLPEPSAGL
jgi:hypothetical protein